MDEGTRILGVDDSLTIRKALELVLKPAGYNLELAASGAEALEKARAFQPGRGRYTSCRRSAANSKPAFANAEHAVAAAMPACAGAQPVRSSTSTNATLNVMPSVSAINPTRTGVRASCRAKKPGASTLTRMKPSSPGA